MPQINPIYYRGGALQPTATYGTAISRSTGLAPVPHAYAPGQTLRLTVNPLAPQAAPRPRQAYVADVAAGLPQAVVGRRLAGLGDGPDWGMVALVAVAALVVVPHFVGGRR